MRGFTHCNDVCCLGTVVPIRVYLVNLFVSFFFGLIRFFFLVSSTQVCSIRAYYADRSRGRAPRPLAVIYPSNAGTLDVL